MTRSIDVRGRRLAGCSRPGCPRSRPAGPRTARSRRPDLSGYVVGDAGLADRQRA